MPKNIRQKEERPQCQLNVSSQSKLVYFFSAAASLARVGEQPDHFAVISMRLEKNRYQRLLILTCEGKMDKGKENEYLQMVVPVKEDGLCHLSLQSNNLFDAVTGLAVNQKHPLLLGRQITVRMDTDMDFADGHSEGEVKLTLSSSFEEKSELFVVRDVAKTIGIPFFNAGRQPDGYMVIYVRMKKTRYERLLMLTCKWENDISLLPASAKLSVPVPKDSYCTLSIDSSNLHDAVTEEFVHERHNLLCFPGTRVTIDTDIDYPDPGKKSGQATVKLSTPLGRGLVKVDVTDNQLQWSLKKERLKPVTLTSQRII